MKIKKGDWFMCIKKVVMDDDVIAYKKGCVYQSIIKDCITDESHCVDHLWPSQVKKFFVKLK